MSYAIPAIFMGVFGVIIAVYLAIISIPQLAGLGFVSATDSANLTSTSTELSTALPIIAIILVIGIVGMAMDKSR